MITTTLHHAIKIAASRRHVFKALADAGKMAAWHVGGIEVEIAVGSTLYLNPKPGLRFGWKTDAMVANERLRQICVEGPGSSVDKILTTRLPGWSGSSIADISINPGNGAIGHLQT
jgi:hypothetical protein